MTARSKRTFMKLEASEEAPELGRRGARKARRAEVPYFLEDPINTLVVVLVVISSTISVPVNPPTGGGGTWDTNIKPTFQRCKIIS